MGQLVAVAKKPSATPGVVRFEINRSLTGMGHERFLSEADAVGPRPAAELARRLFATGQVDAVHVYANMITVDLVEGHDGEDLEAVIRDLYQYWKPGVEPPTFEDMAADEEPAAVGGGGGDGGGDGEADAALTEAAKRVPTHLLERSRSARERWKAKQGG